MPVSVPSQQTPSTIDTVEEVFEEGMEMEKKKTKKTRTGSPKYRDDDIDALFEIVEK